MIEPVTLQKLDQLTEELGDSFFNECGLPGSFKKEAFSHNWKKLLESSIGVMWMAKVDKTVIGSLGGILMPDLNNGELVATELFWYISPLHRKSMWGIKLLNTFESWAKEIGAKRIVMAHLMTPDGDKIDKIFVHRGYKAVEIHYSKEL